MKILHDIHTHNLFSSCCTDYTASTDAYLQKEAALGMRLFGLSNHIWDERVKGMSYWYRTQTIARAEEAKNAFAHAPAGLRVLFGAETEYYACRDLLGMSEDGAAHFDYLLVPHSHLHMRNEVMWEFPEVIEARGAIRERLRAAFPELSDKQVTAMAAALKEPDLLPLVPELRTEVHEYIVKAMTDGFLSLMENAAFRKICGRLPVSVAHPFSPCGVPHAEKNDYLKLLPDDVLTDCFSRAAALGVAMEINVGAVREVNPDLSDNQMIRILTRAKEAGCRFTFGTDSHSVRGLEAIAFGGEIAQALGLVRSDLSELVADAVDP